MNEFTSAQEAWLHELETTDKPQAREALYNGEGWCCLGIKCELDGLQKEQEDEDEWFYHTKDGSTTNSLLPYEAVLELHLRSDSGLFYEPVYAYNLMFESLTDLNDNAEWDFKQIAEYCRRHPENVFRNFAE